MIYLKVLKFFIYGQSCRLPGSASHGVVFRLRISLQIRSENRSGSKCCVRDSGGTDFCKNPRKSASLPCPFNLSKVGTRTGTKAFQKASWNRNHNRRKLLRFHNTALPARFRTIVAFPFAKMGNKICNVIHNMSWTIEIVHHIEHHLCHVAITGYCVEVKMFFLGFLTVPVCTKYSTIRLFMTWYM